MWLALAAVLFAVVGAFYYLRVVWYVYFEEPREKAPVASGRPMAVTLTANSLLVLGLGLYPGALMSLCAAAVGA